VVCPKATASCVTNGASRSGFATGQVHSMAAFQAGSFLNALKAGVAGRVDSVQPVKFHTAIDGHPLASA
jgi:hypothetical protein